MNNRTFTDNNGASWTRVSKQRARALYNAGHTTRLAPALMYPFGPWPIYAEINKLCAPDRVFDDAVNTFEYYNCNSECGKYAAYYVRTEVLA